MTQFRNKHQGRRAFIIGTGPSLKYENLDLIKDELSFTCNRIALIFKKTVWRPTYYFCHTTRTKQKVYRNDVRRAVQASEHAFMSTRVEQWTKPVMVGLEHKVSWVKSMFVDVAFEKYCPEAWFTDMDNGEVSVYGTSGFACIRLAAYMGIKDVYLLGIDLGYKLRRRGQRDINHFDPEYELGFTVSPRLGTEQRHIWCYQLAGQHINIVNCTSGGTLELFQRRTLEEVMEEDNG